MKKFLHFLLFACLLISDCVLSQTYQLTGNPVVTTGWSLIPNGIVNTDFIQLTPDQTGQVGGIKLDVPINLKFCDKWKVEFDFRIDGNGTTQYGRGDGFAFWYLANPPTAFTGGGGLGIPANSTGFMVGFDIFNNTTEGQMSKVHVLYGTNNTAGSNIEYNNTAGSTFHTPDLFTTIPFVNAAYRHVEVNGQVDPSNPANWIVSIKINNIQVVNQSFTPSGGAMAMTQGFFGFSGATGAASARHSIKNVKVFVDKVPLLQNTINAQAVCADPITGVASVNLTSFNSQLGGTAANLTYTYFVQGNPTPIANPSNFQFSGNTIINVLVVDNTSTYCNNPDAVINLNVKQIPVTDAVITVCQYNGVGIYDLTSANVTTLTNATKKYYPTQTDLISGTNEITNPAAFISATGTVYVRIISVEGCVAQAKITLSAYSSPAVNDAEISSCFNEDKISTADFDLTSANVTSAPGTVKTYYPTLSDATAATNQIQNPSVYTSGNNSVYVRVTNNNGCYSIAKITLKVIPAKYSSVLVDKVICIEDRTSLDAGPGFVSYLWSNGATTQSITNVSVGDYWVMLKTGNCITKQSVKVHAASSPTVKNIMIENNTVTLEIVGGTAPYKYSEDVVIWQDSNVFKNLKRGEHTFYVKDAYDCEPIIITVTVPNLINAITPNDDGINDLLNYADLSYKKNVVFTVYDRYGNQVHRADKSTSYVWKGTSSGRRTYTGTYWYTITWNEPLDNTPVQYNGWIVVKNQ
jgi:gliding motility-associated-like protein